MLYRMRSLIEVSPEEARKVLIKAFAEARCHGGDTATALGCKYPTLTRWVTLLGMKDVMRDLEQKAKQEGWHHGRKGGAAYHTNPELRAKRALRTRNVNKKATSQ